MNRQERHQLYQKEYNKSKVELENKYNKSFSNEFLTNLLGHYYYAFLSLSYDGRDYENKVHEYIINQVDLANLNLLQIFEEEMSSFITTEPFEIEDLELFESQNLEKASVKLNNMKWWVYKYDKDPFPSNPHAHEKTENLKLDLSNGDIYQGGIFKWKLKPKKFSELRLRLENKGVKLPKLKNK